MKLKTEISPKLLYQVYAPIFPARVCQICVQPSVQMIPPRPRIWSFLQWHLLLIADSFYPDRHSRNEIENGTKPQTLLLGLSGHLPCESVPNMCTASHADDSTQDASDLFFNDILIADSFFPDRISYFLYSTFYNTISIFFFQRNFTRVITCLIAKIDHIQGRSIVTAILRWSSSRGLGTPQK